MKTRSETWKDLKERESCPVLIVGGGVVGAGLFRELALQGIEALLVDKSDFSAGCSAAPSRMIHGGWRYLEFGESKLVQQSVTERNLLLRNAPHYVTPLPTTVPVMSWFSGLGHTIGKKLGLKIKRPAYRGALMVKIGLTVYDIMSSKTRVMPRHSFASRAGSIARRSLLNPDVKCTATYYDAAISYPERLVLELLMDGEEACAGANALSYVSLQGNSSGMVSLRDELSGEVLQVKPTAVVNATGPWIDSANRLLGHETSMIGGTKGAHLVLDNPELVEQLGDGMIFYETPDGRVSITYAWLGKALIGSTDIRVDDPDEARCDDEEIDYMLNAIRVPFPKLHVDRSQILSYFSGVRPLASSKAAQTGAVSRAHQCPVIQPTDDVPFPVYPMIGGKWTPFRDFSEHVADTILAQLATTRRASTRELAIGGGKQFPGDEDARRTWLAQLGDSTGLDESCLSLLLYRYGTSAQRVAEFITAEPDKSLENHAKYSQREIEFIVRNERVFHLTDLVLRRTSIALLGELTRPLLDELAAITGAVLGWSQEETQADIERTIAILADKFGVNLS
ncbi:MAG: glycerol-3-phosphate dehydrogenase/oxidase [Kiritimatiellia bacterium]|jgi:glycerol-3-phosphate dehydrogenase|nr:glycerol-3-phosphate dehydrogenase/oxidase [Kiritimatiellia bacterium]